MSKEFSNGLDAAQIERLAYLAEEASEVVKACTKILRHGYESHHPEDPDKKTNRTRLERELGDLINGISLMDMKKDICFQRIENEANTTSARETIEKYMHHNKFREDR